MCPSNSVKMRATANRQCSMPAPLQPRCYRQPAACSRTTCLSHIVILSPALMWVAIVIVLATPPYRFLHLCPQLSLPF
ncbi:unnamed protein product [Nezara viridula]|uniref:Uncharacterized protein n=1 Tax=Nezara viridula TaxID=85310 RepID=A0A9P0GYY0_NEZVI|nr:unnamed protein product [Nezara viridula]